MRSRAGTTSQFSNRLKRQFAVRSADFNASARWITDKELIRAHVALAGRPRGTALDLCCGTGQIGRALQAAGWEVRGLDICGSMADISSRYFPVSVGRAEKLPFDPGSFNLVVCRQTFQFLDVSAALSEISRVLAPGGVFVVSLTVPFSKVDYGWLREIHLVKQPLLKKFYTAQDLSREIKQGGFTVRSTRKLKVRESITNWMKYAPELDAGIREKVISMVGNSPAGYRKTRRVACRGGEVTEDWNWVLFKTVFGGKPGGKRA